MRRSFLAVCAVALAAGVAPDRTRAEENPKNDKTAKTLARAREHQLNGETVRFWEVLQGVGDALPVVTPTENPFGPYTHTTLNARGAGLDAIRFTAPGKGIDWDMSWEFITAANAGDGVGWYIGARKGFIGEGFRTFAPETNYAEEGAGAHLPRKNARVTQSLVGQLKAGNEYIIWFSFPDTEPVDYHIRIVLTNPDRK